MIQLEFDYVKHVASVFHLYQAYRIAPGITTFDLLASALEQRQSWIDSLYNERGVIRTFDGWPPLFGNAPKALLQKGGWLHGQLSTPFTWDTAALRAKGVLPGTYVETVTTLNWVNLIGTDRKRCILTFEGDGQETHRKHTIWATSNSLIKNLTILGSRVKYCIHSDGGRDYVLTIENCTLRRIYPEGIRKDYTAAFGIGLHARQHIIMRDCSLEADLPIFLHNWDKQATPCSMTIERCRLTGVKNAVLLNCLGSGQQDSVVIHDSRLQAQEEVLRYTNSQRSEKIPWQGQSEIMVFGSGNKFDGPPGHPLIDDSQDRRSGLERSLAPQASSGLSEGERRGRVP